MWLSAMSPYRVLKSVVDSDSAILGALLVIRAACQWLHLTVQEVARYDFLLVFCSDRRPRWNHHRVIAVVRSKKDEDMTSPSYG